MPICHPCRNAADQRRMELHKNCENRGEDRSHCFCLHREPVVLEGLPRDETVTD